MTADRGLMPASLVTLPGESIAVKRPVLRAFKWPTNGHMIADIATLGGDKPYIGESVLDATFGEGTFWRIFQPKMLTANDQYKDPSATAGDLELYEIYRHDFRTLHKEFDDEFDTVVLDAPYKLSGTPSLGQFDYRFGVDKAMPWQDRMELIRDGAVCCYACVQPGGTLLVKVQDQVCSGAMRWQTDLVVDAIRELGGAKVDRFDFINDPRPQPADRRQIHAQANTSQCLVFRKPQ